MEPPVDIIDFMKQWGYKYRFFYFEIREALVDIFEDRGLSYENAFEKALDEFSDFIDCCRDCFYCVVQLVRHREDTEMFSFF